MDVNKIHYILASGDIKKLVMDVKDRMDYYRGREYDYPPTDELWSDYAVDSRFDSKDVIFVKRILQTVLPEKLRNKISSEFIQNPKHNLYPDIVYKTGDYMYKIGNYLYFAGRNDNQIKHMGHRIELEEIEMNCLKRGVATDICVLYDNEQEKIILLTNDAKVTYENVVNKLKDAIPKYMIPGKVVLIDALPYNARGKIDRNRALTIYKEIKNNV